MTSRMRVTKGHTANRRSHHGIKAPRLSLCKNCEGLHLRHRACDLCGTYRGKEIAKVAKAVNSAAAKQAEEPTVKEEAEVAEA